MFAYRRHVVAVALAAFWAGGAPGGEEPEKPLKVGVVDVAKIFDSYKRTKEDNKNMKVRFEGTREALEKKRLELKQTEIRLKGDPRGPGDLSLIAEKQKLALDKKKLEQDFKKFLIEYEKFNYKHTRFILAEIREAVRRYGERNGYDIILQVDEPKIEGKNTVQVTKSFRDLTALYFSRRVDITPMILAMLNRAFERGISLVQEETIERGNE